ncbi:hypothetical protein [Microvirga flavescens]|uniref:hypothetical protein n=1 Tax=Microvirga flavescens TaxID=2249811 RepID=UPI001300A3F4|nr:hypothetical protein [Microvirga flavescens]
MSDSKTFSVNPLNPVWNQNDIFYLAVYLHHLNEAGRALAEHLEACGEVTLYTFRGQKLISFWDLNDYLSCGFEPGALWVDLRELAKQGEVTGFKSARAA